MATSMALLAVLAGACGYAMRRTGRWSQAGYRFPVLAFLTLTAATVFVLFFMGIPSSSVVVWNEWIESIATTLSELAFFALLWAVVGAYDKLRPGAKVAFGVMVGLVVVVSLALPGTSVLASTNFVAMAILLRLLEVAFLLLLASWLAFWIAIIWAFLTGSLAVWATAKHAPAERQRAAHTNWTARLTIALPSVLFLLLTFAGWAGLMKVSMPLLPHDASVTDKDCPAQSVRDTSAPFKSALCVSPLVPFGSKPRTIQTWTEETLAKAGIGFIPLLLLLVCLAALISVWALAPSILGEVSPPSGSTRDLHKESESLGRWLTDGFTFMRWAGRILYLGVLSFPLGILLAWLYVVHPDWPAVQKYASLAKPFSWALGAIVAGTAVGLLGFGGRLSKLALGFRPAIRVGLDVDNWLREHPRESNPTARICGRYVSLLRYIAQWKAADGRGYDKLVIFSHSQGTIVTADLLRFLNVERLNSETRTYSSYDPLLQGLEKMEIQLFTMGCPLRQLYGLRFPYLYGYAPTGYASDSTSKSKSTIAPDSQGAGAASDSDSADDLMPKPDDLGVDKWVNAYRTGDYVGRHLWKDNPWQPVEGVRFSDWDPPQGLPQHIWTKGKRVEFSIGPGAHTHYWDSTAEAIAETLDILVAKP
jgi:hypothetical protein